MKISGFIFCHNLVYLKFANGNRIKKVKQETPARPFNWQEKMNLWVMSFVKLSPTLLPSFLDIR